MPACEIVETLAEAEAQELPPLIIREPLGRYLDEAGLGDGPIEAQRVGDGHSNATYLVRRNGTRFVLRRPPRPPLPPSAHDMLREARVIAALEHTEARVPRVLLTCEDESILGVPFYVMEEMEGEVITEEVPSALHSAEEHWRIGEEMVDALAELHSVDWRACGLEDFGKPSGYLERQLRRFGSLWERNKTRELSLVGEVGQWLSDHMPDSPPATIVHGEYRLGNLMFAPDAPARAVAIFDWEMATIGDPLADLGYLTATYGEHGEEGGQAFDVSAVTRQKGFPTRDELTERYTERTGRSMTDVRWYQALALWKIAVFMEGNYKAYVEGRTDDPWLAEFDRGVPELVEAAHELTKQPAAG